MTEKEAWIAFSTFPSIGPARFKLLLQNFGTADAAWRASSRELQELGFSLKLLTSFLEHRKNFDLSLYLKKLEKLKISVVLPSEDEYPQRLKEISDAPNILYTCGEMKESLAEISEFSLAVVGTRKMTSYGKDVTERLVTGLVDQGITIISGLAMGVDAAAHRSAIDAGGRTIAVLGGGLDGIYPPSNRGLAQEICQGHGLLISEYPLGYPSFAHNFPQRNRIVSGLSLGVLVIEGSKKSGTLLTAATAGAQGREVFAVPGPITSGVSEAPNYLIKNGAVIVENVQDILGELDIKTKIQISNSKKLLPGSPQEEKVMEILENEGLDIDSLVRIVGMPTSSLLSLLTVMELKGMVKNTAGIYRKA